MAHEIYISGEEETSKQMTEIISDMSVKQKNRTSHGVRQGFVEGEK